MTANDSKSVAVIGLGNMGSALADALLGAGLRVTVWNRTVGKSQPLVENGARVADDPAIATKDADCTIVCLADHEAFVAVIHTDAVAESLEGKQLLQLGGVTAEQSRASGAWAESHGIEYLEASILGIPNHVKTATATLICAGPSARFEACRDVLAVFGNSHLVSEQTGSAYDFDEVYYNFAYASLLGYVQGAALALASGLSIDAYTEIVAERLLQLGAPTRAYGKMLASRNHDGDQASLRAWADGFARSLALCRELGVDDTLPAALMKNLDKAIDAGYAEKEITAVVEVLLPGRRGST